MIFAIILFGYGPILSISAVDPASMTRHRLKLCFMRGGVSQTIYEWRRQPAFKAY